MKFSFKQRIFPILVLFGCHVFTPPATPRANPTEIPFELSRNHIFLRVQVNGTGPYSFMLDTGSEANIIATDILGSVGAKGGTEGAVAGVGEGQSQALVLSNIGFQIGDLRLSPDTVFGMPLDAISGLEGRKVDGLMGYDFFRDHVVEIDYQRRLLRLTDAAGANLGPHAFMLTFINRLPMIDAVLTDERNVDVRCKLEVDTGATRPLLLSASFTRAHPDFQFSNSSIRVPLLGGAGSGSMQRITRVRKVTIGPYEIDQVVTGISESGTGLTAWEGVDGIIGGELLARFHLLVDYAHSRILFEAKSDLRRPFVYDMTGLILFAEGPGLNVYVVRFVLPNSPAAEAGLLVGDIISTVDGKTVSELRISTIAALLSKAGRTHRLEVERDGHKIKMKLTPRPLV